MSRLRHLVLSIIFSGLLSLSSAHKLSKSPKLWPTDADTRGNHSTGLNFNSEPSTSEEFMSSTSSKNQANDQLRVGERTGATIPRSSNSRRRLRPTHKPQLYQFMPTPLPLTSFSANVSKSSEDSRVSGEGGKLAGEVDNEYASGPIALQHFLKFRNESMPPFRLESLTSDQFRAQNASADSHSEDHVKDIFDRFKMNNSDFLSVSSDEKETDFKEQEQKEVTGAKDQQSVENEDDQVSKDGHLDANFHNFPPQSSPYPFNQFQVQHSLPPHQEKSNFKLERNHSPKQSPAHEFQKTTLSFPKPKRGKERVSMSKSKEKNDMEADAKQEIGSRFSDESLSAGKSPHSNFEVLHGFGKKAFKSKNRSPALSRPMAEVMTTESLDSAMAGHSDPSHSTTAEQSKQHNPSEEEPGNKENDISTKGDSNRESDVTSSLHRQASSGRNYPPTIGYDMPYHMPPVVPHAYPPPYPYPIPPLMYPPPPPPPITCCKTYYPGQVGVPGYHKHDMYPHASASNEIEGLTTSASAAKSETASAETTGHPILGHEVPGETFCYQEPVLPHPLLWKQMKLQKLLYPFILKKRLFFG